MAVYAVPEDLDLFPWLEALRSVVLQRLQRLAPTRLAAWFPHDNRVPPSWFRFDLRQPGRLHLTLSVRADDPPGAEADTAVILDALGELELRVPRGRVRLASTLVQPVPLIPSLLGQAEELLRRGLHRWTSLMPLVAMREGELLRAEQLTVDDLQAAAWRRLRLAGPVPVDASTIGPWLLPPGQGPITAAKAWFPCKGRRLPATCVTWDLATVSADWRAPVLAGMLLQIGRQCALGAGSFVPAGPAGSLQA